MRFQKYPSTFHLPWSRGVTSDDKVMPDINSLEGREVVITEKMDGECFSLYRNKVHARSLDSVNHPSRNWVKNFWGQIRQNIPEGVRICGENCYAKHSIFYTNLDSYFLGFNAWKDNTCLSWNNTLDLFGLLGITPVPVLYEGIWDENVAVEMAENMDLNKSEGYVVRITDSFELEEFNLVVGKFVRQGHVQTDEHWMRQAVTPNILGNIYL